MYPNWNVRLWGRVGNQPHISILCMGTMGWCECCVTKCKCVVGRTNVLFGQEVFS